MSSTYVSKIVMIGDAEIGKTRLVRKAQGIITRKDDLFTTSKGSDEYSPYVPTIGVDVFCVEIDGKTFNVWDCAGQEKFEGLREGYYIGASGAIVMARTPESAKKWIKEFRKVRGNKDKPIEIMLENAGDIIGDISVFSKIARRIEQKSNTFNLSDDEYDIKTHTWASQRK